MPPGRPKKVLERLTPGLIADGREIYQRATSITFPSARYREDPVAFCQEILGVEPWSKQVEILEAVRDHKRVAVSSGHKIGKSRSAAMLALWFYCSYSDARVIFTSTTSRQVDEILWRELCMVRARGGRCVDCKAELERMRAAGVPNPEGRIPRPCPHSALIDGEQGELARTGLRSSDFRQIVGFTAKQAEAVAGISGANLLYLPDEASGIPQVIFEAMEGNRAGGARLAMFSNPTKNEGEFYDAFASKKDLYHTIRVSSEETPNVVLGIEDYIPGLANPSWIEEKKREWGENSPLYKVRVKGEHALQEGGRIFSIHAIRQAEVRWSEASEEGRLFVGIDPAGASGKGDESAFAVRRGLKVVEIQAAHGLTAEQHLIRLLSILSTHREPREVPVVVMDREGAVGAELYGALRAHLNANPGQFVLSGVRASDKAVRQADVYDRMRDGLCANLELWFRDGGAIPQDAKLAADLHVFEWKQAINGRFKCTDKETIRKILGRSPDRYDAVALAVWEPMSVRDSHEVVGDVAPPGTRESHGVQTIDPYASSGAWGRRGG